MGVKFTNRCHPPIALTLDLCVLDILQIDITKKLKTRKTRGTTEIYQKFVELLTLKSLTIFLYVEKLYINIYLTNSFLN